MLGQSFALAMTVTLVSEPERCRVVGKPKSLTPPPPPPPRDALDRLTTIRTTIPTARFMVKKKEIYQREVVAGHFRYTDQWVPAPRPLLFSGVSLPPSGTEVFRGRKSALEQFSPAL